MNRRQFLTTSFAASQSIFRGAAASPPPQHHPDDGGRHRVGRPRVQRQPHHPHTPSGRDGEHRHPLYALLHRRTRVLADPWHVHDRAPLFPLWHNNSNEGALPKQEITLARMLKSQGYSTGHFGKWHLGTLSKDFEDGRRRRPNTKSYSPPWERDYDECFVTEPPVPTWNPMGYQRSPRRTGPGRGNSPRRS